ncbi:TrbC/VirB2 family protein [Bacillus cereus]|jgi:type IV secretory pathway VirB2 component (pilin)|uniref:TrbC/VirB2 family protein n=1 Tax=Bacillus cereus TaxID=1396 RepID=UPI00187A107E|nr:TrbC/VirB2 family protein [Bacillus cereus]MBE7106149.1 TrbC/VirB2 family protein [Bacillus cereus]
MEFLDYFYFSILQHLAYNDIFDSVGNIFKAWSGRLQTITIWIAGFCVIVTGIMFIFGEGPSRTAKKWLIYIVAGCIIVWGAAEIVQTVQGVSKGGF